MSVTEGQLLHPVKFYFNTSETNHTQLITIISITMRFLLPSAVALLTTTLASAAAVLEKKGPTVIDTVGTIVNNLDSAVTTSTDNIGRLKNVQLRC